MHAAHLKISINEGKYCMSLNVWKMSVNLRLCVFLCVSLGLCVYTYMCECVCVFLFTKCSILCVNLIEFIDYLQCCGGYRGGGRR